MPRSELNKTTSTRTQENQANLQAGEEGWRPPGKGQWSGSQVTWSPRENPRPDSYQVSFFSSFFSFFFPFFFLAQSFLDFTLPNSSFLAPRSSATAVGLASHVAQVQVSLLYPPVGRDLLGLVALHVLLHGGQAGAVLRADGALVGRGAVVRPQVLDHGRVVPGALVAELTLKGLLTCGGRAGESQDRGRGREGLHRDALGPPSTLGLVEEFSTSRWNFPW